MVVFMLDGLEVFFPYEYIYPEQYAYIKYLKKTLDNNGHCVLEMPTGTGKTVAVFSLITSYQYDKRDDSKFIFCTRTVAEMEKSLIELKKVINYRVAIIKQRKLKKNNFVILAIGINLKNEMKQPISVCPYFVAKKLIQEAKIVVLNYQYILDPKVSKSIFLGKDSSSRMLNVQKKDIIVFDEAHNIDSVCLEALSVNIDRNILNKASMNIKKLFKKIEMSQALNEQMLKEECNKILQQIRKEKQVKDVGDGNIPILMQDIIKKMIVPGNIRNAKHFLNLMRVVVLYLKKYINTYEVTSEGPLSFLYKCEKQTKLDTSFFRYCFDRLKMLLNTLHVINIDEYACLNVVCNFCTLLGSYVKGFILICEPYPEATGIYDPVLQFACLDSSIAMKYVLSKYKSVVLTSGTISPLELYPKLLNFETLLTASFPMSFDRKCVCPLIVTKSVDLIPLSSQYCLRNDMNVIKNYGLLLYEICKNIPDGVVGYFPSYIYMEQVISTWYEIGILGKVLEHKLIFIETKDIVATTIALHNYKKACDLGKGALFLSICRGKIAEGIDFDKHYGKCVLLFGIPYQYTLSRILKARLEFLKEVYNIKENDFLVFDAMRQASQCVGRIIRNKKDYGIMLFADVRYARNDKKSKLPPWIIKCMDMSHVNLNVSTAVDISKQFLLKMSQTYKETGQTKLSQAILNDQNVCWHLVKSVLNLDSFI
uniref:General transcription and DNA repair factor IIH helicase subunit XPD n=1 Tax=Piliocolobus tephrosceles TaxID=591936 RepID=A0A8C9GPI1_9PRIM